MSIALYDLCQEISKEMVSDNLFPSEWLMEFAGDSENILENSAYMLAPLLYKYLLRYREKIALTGDVRRGEGNFFRPRNYA